jgi:hypothetical protein
LNIFKITTFFNICDNFSNLGTIFKIWTFSKFEYFLNQSSFIQIYYSFFFYKINFQCRNIKKKTKESGIYLGQPTERDASGVASWDDIKSIKWRSLGMVVSDIKGIEDANSPCLVDGSGFATHVCSYAPLPFQPFSRHINLFQLVS